MCPNNPIGTVDLLLREQSRRDRVRLAAVRARPPAARRADAERHAQGRRARPDEDDPLVAGARGALADALVVQRDARTEQPRRLFIANIEDMPTIAGVLTAPPRGGGPGAAPGGSAPAGARCAAPAPAPPPAPAPARGASAAAPPACRASRRRAATARGAHRRPEAAEATRPDTRRPTGSESPRSRTGASPSRTRGTGSARRMERSVRASRFRFQLPARRWSDVGCDWTWLRSIKTPCAIYKLQQNRGLRGKPEAGSEFTDPATRSRRSSSSRSCDPRSSASRFPARRRSPA